MMNVETVLSNTSESDVGGSNSNVRLYSSNPQSARQPRASKRVSQDPPGDTVTPMEAAFLELVPQDVVAMDDVEDYQSTQSTLTNPPTINFLNQPTDEDWEREHSNPYSSNLIRDNFDPNRNEIRRSQHNRPSNTQSRSNNPKPSQKPQGYDSDESSSLPEAPGTRDDEHDTDEDDVLNFLKRTYTPADESLLFSDHVMDDIIEEEEERQSYQQQQQPKGRASLDEGVHRNKSPHPPPSNRDEMQRISSKKSMASTIDTTTAQKKHPRHRQRPRQSSKVVEEDDVDSDLTPVMKSPHHSKASFQPKQQKDKQATNTSSLRSAPFQSPASKKKAPTSKKSKVAPSKSNSTSKQAKADHSKSKRSVRPDKTREATAKATATPSQSKRSVKSGKVKEANLKPSIATPSKSKRSVRPDSTKRPKAAPLSNRKSQPQDSKDAKKKKQGYKSPTSVLDDPNQQRKSPKTSTLQRGSDPYLSEGDSSSSSYRFFGKKQPKQDRNALLGLDDASSTSSSLFNTGKRRPTRIFGQEPTPPKADQTDRNALLGLDDASSTSSSLYGKTGPTRIFGSREDENRHSQLLGYDDFDIDDDAVGNGDDEGSSLGLGHNHRRQQANRARGDTGKQQQQQQPVSPSPSPSDIMMPEHGPRYADRFRPPREQQQLQSFSQIPIHPDMTPEEWQIAQEQIKFLENELDKVSALCQELTEAVDKEEEGGDEERGGGNASTPGDEDWIRAQEQVKYLEQELTTVQELCTLLTSTAKESTDAIEMLEGDKQRLEDLIARLERAMARSKDRIAKRDKALEHLVQENESKCCSWCWDWISEPVVWFVSYLYRIDGGESLRRER
ncbi:MAG: hypothetical protein SGBAC_007439 [Bacillariaceae sp.]